MFETLRNARLDGGTLMFTDDLIIAEGLFQESASEAVTAFAGGGQTDATLLIANVNRIGTVATAADSVKLPTGRLGLVVLVINAAANACQVFGSGTDTIDGVATATGVSQMPKSAVFYICGAVSDSVCSWYTEGLSAGYGTLGLRTLSYAPTVTAFSGGGQSSATALTAMINRISTVAAQGDSVRLPTALPGMVVMVLNRGAFPCQVFGAGTDTINSIATATGISQGTNTTATYVCSVAGNWEVPLTALVSSSAVALTTNGAIPPHVSQTYVITKAGVLADTLAAPTATTDDGLIITIFSDTANAHTLTATSLLDTGSANVSVATFAAFKGAGLTLMAYNARWKVLSSVGITFS